MLSHLALKEPFLLVLLSFSVLHSWCLWVSFFVPQTHGPHDGKRPLAFSSSRRQRDESRLRASPHPHPHHTRPPAQHETRGPSHCLLRACRAVVGGRHDFYGGANQGREGGDDSVSCPVESGVTVAAFHLTHPPPTHPTGRGREDTNAKGGRRRRTERKEGRQEQRQRRMRRSTHTPPCLTTCLSILLFLFFLVPFLTQAFVFPPTLRLPLPTSSTLSSFGTSSFYPKPKPQPTHPPTHLRPHGTLHRGQAPRSRQQ